jgi:hypothetical protein
VLALRTRAAQPLCAVSFDLAGAHPTTDASDLDRFAEQVGLSILAAMCTSEVSQHRLVEESLPQAVWEQLETPEAMARAGAMFTKFGFFTQPVTVEKLLGYRAVSEAVSAHYSEGCYAAYDIEIPGLITTATGSARLVDKRAITRDDQAIVVGVTPERDGALVRPVEGMERVVPSVEAVELMSICQAVPTHERLNRAGEPVMTPNVRAILHGHLGVEQYDPEFVECVTLDAPYHRHLVSCGTGALARGTATAFARSAALQQLDDPRSVVFVEQPGHGVVIVEKWVEGNRAFEAIYEQLAQGRLRMTMDVPQGPVMWEAHAVADGRRVMRKVVTDAVRSRISL